MVEARFRDGRKAKYSNDVVDSMRLDNDVVEVIDLETGEVLIARDKPKITEVTIMQIKKDTFDRHYKIFEPYDKIIKEYGKIDLSDYEVVYDGYFEDDNVKLEYIYYIFNMVRPEGFTGHSLSTSDIIILNGNKYYVDSIGFKKLD